MNYIALFFYDYGKTILLAVLLGCLILLCLVYGRQIIHEVVMMGRWGKAYADAIRKTIRQERSRSRDEKRIERLEHRADRARAKRDAARIKMFGATIERMMRDD